MICSKFELLGVYYFVSHFNSISHDNQSSYEDNVYIGYSLPLFAPLSLPSLPLIIAYIPCSFA
jgi:hypothetical protein